MSVANHKIAQRAKVAYIKRRPNNFKVDKGGGSGRVGTRVTPAGLLSKSDLLRGVESV